MIGKLSNILISYISIVIFAFSMPAYAGDDIELAGDILQYIISATAGGVAIYKGDKEGVFQFSKSFLTTLGATYALKYAINADRPNGGSHSFPSGHTSSAFLRGQCTLRYWMGSGLYPARCFLWDFPGRGRGGRRMVLRVGCQGPVW